MERITNDRSRFLTEIKKELFDFKADENWTTIFEYLEMPFFLTYAYSINFSSNTNQTNFRLVQKTWNSKYDLSRFKFGIFNIDRLAISQTIIETTINENAQFISVPKKKLDTLEFKGIILDGLICELKVSKTKQHLKWNIDEEMNKDLSILVNNIRKRITID